VVDLGHLGIAARQQAVEPLQLLVHPLLVEAGWKM
jgi:hypothetical protein